MSGCPVEVRHPRLPRARRRRRLRRARPTSCSATTPCRRPPAGSAPRKTQCEGVCVRGKKGEPVAIGWLERFVADWAAANMRVQGRRSRADGQEGGGRGRRPRRPDRRRRTGPPGSRGARLRGPARHRRRAALRHPRVPSAQATSSTARSRTCARLGVTIECNVIIGRTLTVDELMARRLRRRVHRQRRRPADVPGHPRREPQGRLLGQRVPHPGQPHEGLHDLRRRHARSRRGKRVVVFGGGNMAMDARAHRPAAGRRRRPSAPTAASRAEMPARVEEIPTPRKRASTSSS